MYERLVPETSIMKVVSAVVAGVVPQPVLGIAAPLPALPVAPALPVVPPLPVAPALPAAPPPLVPASPVVPAAPVVPAVPVVPVCGFEDPQLAPPTSAARAAAASHD
jgi:hypothetical protein